MAGQMGNRSGIFALTIVLSAACFGQAKPDFAKDVQPILQSRCVMCHSERMAQNGVRFDDGDAALAGGYSGPVIIAGKSGESKLIVRVTGAQKAARMPPVGEPLTPAQIATLKAWIDSGAEWPRPAKTAAAAPTRSGHWAFQPVTKPALPSVRNRAWVKNPVDSFVLARLEAEGIQPSPEALKSVLIRRVSLDLTGLPPTPEEVAQFLADARADAYERLVERLLASPHYGEQRARAWLDQARYADSDGFEKDKARPYAWRWRDWVIDAYNRDMPFEEFTIEQLAGDLLPRRSNTQLVATGFHRNALTNREGGTDPAENRFEQMVNRTNTIGTVWLGLTVGCAQCHDHKYDPVKQKDYYQLYAFFNRAEEVDIDAPLPGEMGAWMRARPGYLAARDHLLMVYDAAAMQADWEVQIRAAMDAPGKDLDWDFEVANGRPMFDRFEAVLRTPPAERSERDRERLLYWFIENPGPAKNRDADQLACMKELRRRLQALDASTPQLTMAPAMREQPAPTATYIALKGDYRAKGLEVQPDAPSFLPPLPKDSPRNRLTLAAWLVSPENPLTARVAVNRLWQEMFGRGLVRTSEDFGTQGDRPSHPELLDWLAVQFRDNGWSVKETLRLIVTSSTYRQSSNTRPELADKDPENVLLARQSRLRLSAENIRDSALSVGGLLNTALGGPSVRPPQPSGIAELGYANSVKWTDDDGPARYRRGLYVHFQRTTPYPMLVNFDAPDSNVACSRRRRSNSPLQALNLLNDPVFFEASQATAMRILRESPPDQRLDYAFRLTLGRPPNARERQRLSEFLQQQSAALAQSPEQAAALLPLQPAEAAWASAARVLLNLDEFITRE
jgi:hypothetical protein